MGFADNDIKYLKGVGDARARELAREFEIHTFRDLLYYFPFRYVDKSRFYRISELHGEMPAVQLRGHFIQFNTEGEGARQRLKGVFSDGERLMECVWFSKVKSLANLYKPGVPYVIFGKPAEYRNIWSMAHPEITPYDETRPPTGFTGVYNLTDVSRRKGFSTKAFNNLARNVLTHPGFSTMTETLPPEVVTAYRLMPLHDALREMHFPTHPDRLAKARERMKFEELFYLELQILRYSRERSLRIPGIPFPKIGPSFNKYYKECLPFELTGAQKRVLHEIRDDMRQGRQMNRLLQGDVGSGKTIVAFMTLLMAVDNGCQGALMAPTEILAGQHYETLRAWGERIGLRVELLTGSTRTAKRREIHQGLLDGDIHILVGTHALIEDGVRFRRLGVAVIDEQHRFGVAQRARMWKKGEVAPHVLVMTATPIPRTLAMTVYGDLDVSVIDELPPNRKPVTTVMRYEEDRMEVYRLVQRELNAGRQVYVVYPLVKENPKLELKSVEEGRERLAGIFSGWQVGMVHGQMKPDAKDEQMERFLRRETSILVATTVIEVGVNVPNASVMIIENAERFGLSQLHQLRGRVGRGADRSYCVLMTKRNIGGDTRKRLNVMTATTDGFLVSEADMKMRGPGDMEGTQQSGVAWSLRVASLATDGQILNLAREAAEKVLDARPELVKNPHAVGSRDADPITLSDASLNILTAEMRYRFQRDYDWSMIS